VTLHGFLGNSHAWDAVCASLKTPLSRTLALTLPGHHFAPYNPRDRWSDVVQQFRSMLKNHRQIVLAGYSMGARLALALALEAQLDVRAVVVVGAHPGIALASERSVRTAWEAQMAERVTELGLQNFVALWQGLPMWESQRSLPTAQRAALTARRSAHDPGGISWAMTALGTGSMPNFRQQLATTTTAMLWVTGALDPSFSAHAAELSAINPAVKHSLIADAGHDCTVEQPTAVAAAMDVFLQTFTREEA
jgi:2-succinyl-6-hydroxy-2,4-cyclohexadiene-1-carboxylate synthase